MRRDNIMRDITCQVKNYAWVLHLLKHEQLRSCNRPTAYVTVASGRLSPISDEEPIVLSVAPFALWSYMAIRPVQYLTFALEIMAQNLWKSAELSRETTLRVRNARADEVCGKSCRFRTTECLPWLCKDLERLVMASKLTMASPSVDPVQHSQRKDMVGGGTPRRLSAGAVHSKNLSRFWEWFGQPSRSVPARMIGTRWQFHNENNPATLRVSSTWSTEALKHWPTQPDLWTGWMDGWSKTRHDATANGSLRSSCFISHLFLAGVHGIYHVSHVSISSPHRLLQSKGRCRVCAAVAIGVSTARMRPWHIEAAQLPILGPVAFWIGNISA
jgi:hypothetical protein